MPKERVCANNKDHPKDPVSSYENRRVKGLALCAPSAFEENISEAKSLRERHQRFLDGLPEMPDAALDEALNIMHPNGDNYPKGIEDALHLSYALETMISSEALDVDGRPKEAAKYIAAQLALSMHEAALELDRMQYVLGNPKRLARERSGF